MSSPPPIEGKYEVLAKIREGGMGALYLVRHRLLSERRVIKVMRPELAQSAEQQKRFLREAQTATRLKHENIVGFYDFFVDQEGTAFMVMEYIEGITLRDMVLECGRLPIALAVQISGQCLAALDYLHRKGIVHRDISPDNIMVMAEEDGTLHAKLIDLGIAKIVQGQEELTATGEFLGKLRYSSPEQLVGRSSSGPIDGRSDLFSLAVVIYEILTGTCPYPMGSLSEILIARLHQPPMPFEQADPGGRVSPGLRAVIQRALQRKPGDRYSSAAQFAEAIRALLPNESAPEPPEEVKRYLSRAFEAARRIVAERPSGGESMQPALRSKFPATPTGPRAPFTGRGREPNRDPEPTVAMAADEPRVAPPEKKPSRILVFGLAAGGAVLLLAAGMVIASKWRAAASGSGPDRAGQTAPGQVSPASLRPPAPLEGAPTIPGSPQAQPSVEQLARQNIAQPTPELKKSAVATPKPSLKHAEERKAEEKKEERKRPRVAEQASTLPAAAAEVQQPPRPKARFCSQLDETDYKQLIAREVAPGFGGTAAKVPREDSGLMQIRVTVSPEHPAEDEQAFVHVKFENGGDNPVQIEELRESLSRGGYRAVANALVPVTVLPGGVKELYQYQVDLRGGEPYRKQFVVVDKKSDSWKAGFSLLPCAQ